MSGIIWLASYPKSGSTWFRIFLLNLQSSADSPSGINDLVEDGSTKIASSRSLFDRATGIDSSDLTEDEIARLRLEVFEQLAAESEQTAFIKIHDAFEPFEADGGEIAPQSSRGVVYFIRSPLDVAASWAHHTGRTIDATIERMADESLVLCPAEGGLQWRLRETVLSWSKHVASWMDGPQVPVHLVRYEDMKRRPLATFTSAVRFVGLESDPERIQQALEFSSFQELQKQERLVGFDERFSKSPSFFRKGEAGSWRFELTPQQVSRIIRHHGPMMRRFGYLTQEGQPII